MASLQSFAGRVRPWRLVVLAGFVGVAAYFEFVYAAPSSVFAVVTFLVGVPLLFVATLDGVRDHRWYSPVVYAGLVVLGVLQYLDGNWRLLAGLWVALGLAGLAWSLVDRRR